MAVAPGFPAIFPVVRTFLWRRCYKCIHGPMVFSS